MAITKEVFTYLLLNILNICQEHYHLSQEQYEVKLLRNNHVNLTQILKYFGLLPKTLTY